MNKFSMCMQNFMTNMTMGELEAEKTKSLLQNKIKIEPLSKFCFFHSSTDVISHQKFAHIENLCILIFHCNLFRFYTVQPRSRGSCAPKHRPCNLAL